MATTYNAIATTTLSGASSTITFSSISTSYTDLILRVSGSVTADTYLYLRFNNYASNGYGWGGLVQTSAGGNPIQDYHGTSATNLIYLGPTSANNPFALVSEMNGYTESTFLKQVISRLWCTTRNSFFSGLRGNGTSITTIQLSTASGQFNAGTTATLIGILRA